MPRYSLDKIAEPALKEYVFEQISIIAPGLLGASLAMALKNKLPSTRICVWARREETRREIALLDWCDQVTETPEECVAQADLSILCPPVDIISMLLKTLTPHFKKGSLVTDVGSVKAPICEAGRRLSKHGIHFIGSHPMAGSEKSGYFHATPELFQGRPCILTPEPETPSQKLHELLAFWELLGMRTLQLTPEAHDEQIAWISHLPHLLASALSKKLHTTTPEAREYAGQGLRDTTRIAAGDPDMWTAIFKSNRTQVSRALEQCIQELEEWHKILQDENWSRLKEHLAEGKLFRETLS